MNPASGLQPLAAARNCPPRDELARGTAKFRTTIAEGQALMRELRARASGLCQPGYVLDIPGGHGKSPIGPNYLRASEGVGHRVEDFRGNCHQYPPAPVG